MVIDGCDVVVGVGRGWCGHEVLRVGEVVCVNIIVVKLYSCVCIVKYIVFIPFVLSTEWLCPLF